MFCPYRGDKIITNLICQFSQVKKRIIGIIDEFQEEYVNVLYLCNLNFNVSISFVLIMHYVACIHCFLLSDSINFRIFLTLKCVKQFKQCLVLFRLKLECIPIYILLSCNLMFQYKHFSLFLNSFEGIHLLFGINSHFINSFRSS